MKSWSDYKMDTPGVHMFVKTMDMNLFGAVNEIADEYGFDVELLNDGFVIPNVDYYDAEVKNDVLALLGGFGEKGLARGLARGLRGAVPKFGRRALRDGDSDGNVTNPATGRDELPAPPKPRMMPPREIPKEVPEKQPQTVPTRTPSRPATAPKPTPARPQPARPAVPAGIAGAMATGRGKPNRKRKKVEKKKKREKIVIPGIGEVDREDFDRRMGPAIGPITDEQFRTMRQAIIDKLTAEGNGGITGSMSASKRKLLGEHILRQLREYELDPSSPSKAPRRAMEMALDEIAQRNAMTRKQLDKILRRLIMRERRNAVLRRAGKLKSADGPEIYMSMSDFDDIELKTGLSVDSRDIDTLVINAEPEMMFEVKAAIDEIGEFYGFGSVAGEGGIYIQDSSYLPSDAIDAIANAYMNIAGGYDLVDFELRRVSE